jgi:hypothetical protein
MWYSPSIKVKTSRHDSVVEHGTRPWVPSPAQKRRKIVICNNYLHYILRSAKSQESGNGRGEWRPLPGGTSFSFPAQKFQER